MSHSKEEPWGASSNDPGNERVQCNSQYESTTHLIPAISNIISLRIDERADNDVSDKHNT